MKREVWSGADPRGPRVARMGGGWDVGMAGLWDARSGPQRAGFGSAFDEHRAEIKGGKGAPLSSSLRGAAGRRGGLFVIGEDAPGLTLSAEPVFDPKAVHPDTTMAFEPLAQ